MADLRQYIIQAAKARGIDPNVALEVARREGGFKDPTLQSFAKKNGIREPSYGPFQLLVGGEGTGYPLGLGNDALKAGIDPRNPDHALKGIDFALDTAARDGWGRWYGAKAAGITGMEGINGRGVTLNSVPSEVAAQGNAPMLDDPKVVATRHAIGTPMEGDVPAAPALAAAEPTLGDKLGTSIFGEEMAGKLKGMFGAGSPDSSAKTGLGMVGKALGGGSADTLAREHSTPIQSALPAAEAADAGRMAAAQQLMATLMTARRKPRGLTIGG